MNGAHATRRPSWCAIAVPVLLAGACDDNTNTENTVSDASVAPERAPDSGAEADASGSEAGPWAGAGPTAIDGPLPVSSDSYPFGAADHLRVPMDLEAMGYIEEEFIVHGDAQTYDWAEDGVVARTAAGPYATRVLVRRPTDPSDFSGSAFVELLNPTNLFDLEIGWALSHKQFVRNGDAWIGVTSKPIAIKALKTFDAERYADLSWANPAPEMQAGCSLRSDSDPATEDGLIWDVFAQIGGALRNGQGARQLVGAAVTHVYGFGYSQSGSMLNTYISAFHTRDTDTYGAPIYDGYVSATGGGVAPLHQCAPALPATDPRANRTDVGVPILRVNTQTDARTLYWARKADADAPQERFRLYEIAGAGHATDAEIERGPAFEDISAAGVAPPPAECAGMPRSRFPVGLVFNAVFANLDRWVRADQAPPPGRVISVSESDAADALGGVVIEVDEHGNALGGVRLPHVEAPTATWNASTPAGGGLICLLTGHEVPFDADKLTALYADHDAYVTAVDSAVSALVEDGYLMVADGEALVAEAEGADVP